MYNRKNAKRAFTSPIRFFGSDDVSGMQNAVNIVLERASRVAEKAVKLTVFMNSIMVSDDGKPLNVDFNEEQDRWEYENIFNHPIDITDEKTFGLNSDEFLTLVQLSSEYMNVKTYNGDTEYSVDFHNGVTGNNQPCDTELYKKRVGTSIHWIFDSSLFLSLTMDIPLDYYRARLQELAKQFVGKTFVLCVQPDSGFLERFEYVCKSDGEIKTLHSKIRGSVT